jgi:HTH-type transcriptional regulator, transcriptional repressor of NAD biosynthesis genes
MTPRPTTGMVLGKFMPPHLGHVYLVEFARNYVDQLTVVVGTLQAEPIPGELRFRWMRELFPDVNVVHHTDENPQEPAEHPDFWRIWHDSLMRVLPGRPDFVFASEDYGWKLAEVLQGRFIPVDKARGVMPVSGTAVRRDPLGNWQYLPRCVRPYFARRVCVFGPESTGKSTLAGRLAEHFQTVVVPEYARILGEAQNGKLSLDDMECIARGQIASEEALARNANRVLICDTDVLITTIWSDVLYGSCQPWIRAEAERRTYDLYLLTDVDVPWVRDPVRYLPENRTDFLAVCEQALRQRDRLYVKLSGDWEQRFQTACRAVTAILERKEQR